MLMKTMLVMVTLFAISASTSCDRELEEPDGGKIKVVTTTYPLTFIAERIGGERISVVQMVKPGVEAHDFEPAPSDIVQIKESDVFVYNHPSFEGWSAGLIDRSNISANANTIWLQTVQLGESDKEHRYGDQTVTDPHVWLNPLETIKQSERILSGLVEADPQGSHNYTRNADALKVELLALDKNLAEQLSNCDIASVIVSHEAFGHMAERYGFSQIGLAGLAPDFESSPSRLTHAIKTMSDLGIRHILQEPIATDELSKTLAEETGAEVEMLHPLESLSFKDIKSGETYLSVMKSNGNALSKAMGCN
jgi:zinc transport system substrate-binding protein